MEAPRPTAAPLTPSQRQAVEAVGNVLVMAGADTGKTKVLVPGLTGVWQKSAEFFPNKS